MAQKESELSRLNRRLNTLSIFRSILEDDVVGRLQALIDSIGTGSLEEQLRRYGDFTGALFEAGGNITTYVRTFLQDDMNFYLRNTVKRREMSENMHRCLEEELDVMQELASLPPSVLISQIGCSGFLPEWDTAECDIPTEYHEMLNNIPTRGYGKFARYRFFTVKNGTLDPVKYADPQSLDQLYGYERERRMVYENTRALAEGIGAANVLLYGDAGTGKSSTIKACANAFADRGVRLIEFDKKQLNAIPKIIDQLYDTPLKYIFFIDDLSFTTEDDNFSYLKGMLEGNSTGKSDNIAIYASSNRRHLVRELNEDRAGSDIHLNDTLQQTMSLSARFGLTITFQKPEKDLYLEIVKKLAAEEEVTMPEEELCRKAEAFAIRSNGRSPRTAKQFIQQILIGIQ
ncbi:MAG: DUF815 domain-containing protein [Eubacterium pyruvativorans]|uniref:ATP-binding protein n=1 Tax=Eubacterium pyruvativorans TaxID=155865 RepID=UPI002409DACD|nr:DUF815 domain-containing protein [Eubacterium pyruvativorans]MDD6707832.1 DUF815 domain-containing protein [Eubacterium pyruvativorans]